MQSQSIFSGGDVPLASDSRETLQSSTMGDSECRTGLRGAVAVTRGAVSAFLSGSAGLCCPLVRKVLQPAQEAPSPGPLQLLGVSSRVEGAAVPAEESLLVLSCSEVAQRAAVLGSICNELNSLTPARYPAVRTWDEHKPEPSALQGGPVAVPSSRLMAGAPWQCH